ncbi:MAG: RluA family pseudouridine synthase [bacterium]
MNKIKILFEDKNVLALYKPASIAVHADLYTKKTEKTLTDFILAHDKSIGKVGEPMEVEFKGKQVKIIRPGIVHRLDRETSGVLLVAKNKKTFDSLKEQFQNHTIKKVYRAFVYGPVTDPRASLATGGRGVINAPLGRSPVDIRMWTAGRGARPPLREATTEYKVLDRFKSGSEGYSYMEVYPRTGRTHQIRVHMRYINHPVVSDPLYRGDHKLALGMKRLALHALSITYKEASGETRTIEAPLPDDFKAVLKKYLKRHLA